MEDILKIVNDKIKKDSEYIELTMYEFIELAGLFPSGMYYYKGIPIKIKE